MISSGLVIFGGIFSITDISTSDCLDGTAFGMTMVATIAAAGENLKPRYRGRILSVQVLGVSIGMVIYSIVFPFYASEGDLRWFRIFGYISIGCGLLAFITSFYANNSPIHYIQNKAPQRAINAIQKLYMEKGSRNPSQKVYKKFTELEKYVREMSTFTKDNLFYDLLAFLKIAVIRVLMTILTSSCFIIFFYAYFINHKTFSLAIYFFGFSRLLGAIVFIFMIDWTGRKILSMASFFSLGVLFVVLGVLHYTEDEQIALMVIPVVGQLFTGLGEGVSTIYMAEAFSLRGKTLLICLLIGLENAAMILFNEFLRWWINEIFCLSLGIVSLIAVAFVFVFLPETKKASLTEARSRFSKVFSIKF